VPRVLSPGALDVLQKWFAETPTAAEVLSASSRPIRTESRATVGLCFRETGFFGTETVASKRPVTFDRSSAETKSPRENPPIRRYLHDTGKSLFLWDCVVGLRGLELRANHAVAIEPISGP
jgi:hypothetical protein